jgi:sulfotransferase family protein
MTAKIFGIGLSRTGTSSLSEALSILGYRSVHYPPAPNLYELLDAFDAATDTPIAMSFKELDHRYPGSKFILTVRDRDKWLKSTEKLFSGPIPLEEWRREERRQLYGTLIFEKREFAAAYDLHLARVMEHFVDRPDDLLIMDVSAGWDALCRFLHDPIPDAPFPKISFRGAATYRMPEGYMGEARAPL